jgi:hypothetical protein
MGLAIAARLVWGPFVLLGFPVNTPLNPEGMFGLAVTLLLLPGSGRGGGRTQPGRWPGGAGAIALLSIAAFLPALRVYFLSDDFVLLRQALDWQASGVLASFTQPGGDGFYRPLGYLSLAADAAWAGTSPALWHVTGIVLHTVNALLVAWLASRWGASPAASIFAGALFALHGGRPEAVAWIAARFDLLATFFALASILLFDQARPVWSLLAFLGAVSSKESAYVVPLVLAVYSRHLGRPVRRTLPWFALAAALFGWRLLLFGGLGGYQQGPAQMFSSGAGTALKNVLVRLWTGLYFPINWSVEPPGWLTAACLAALAALVWLAWTARPSQAVWPALASLLVSILPPLHLLSAGPDLAGQRLLYLPSVFFCLFLAAAWDGLHGRARMAAAAGIVVFHLAALQHNLSAWSYASERVREACAAAAAHENVRAEGLPLRIRGAQAFNNGFAECTGLAAGDIRRGLGDPARAAVLEWDPARDALAPAAP